MAAQSEPGKMHGRDGTAQSEASQNLESAGREKASEDARAAEAARERAFARDDGDTSSASSGASSSEQALQGGRAASRSQAERNRRDPLIDTPDNCARSNRPGVDRPVTDRAGRMGAGSSRTDRGRTGGERAGNPSFDDAGHADDTRKATNIQSGVRNREG